ncbi:MAG: type II secretion system protein [Capsulimonadales bacterium]|nr:type II secretion system protein [Capsulimonadales bacterium]
MHRPSASARTRAFGLIELLVVAVIIAILASLLLPRLLGGTDPVTKKRIVAPRERAKQVAGTEYIGQINLALQMYRQDHDDRNPETLLELKSYGVTDEMLLDPVTKRPLAYDPVTGRVGNSGGTAEIPNLGGGANLPQIGP